MASRVIPVDPFDLVIFGGTGDLAKRKILPGLFRRFVAGQMPFEALIKGAARAEMDDMGYRDLVKTAILEISGSIVDEKLLSDFLEKVTYLRIDATGDTGWLELSKSMRDGPVRAFYFSVAPALFGALAERLKQHKIALCDSRIVVEKPFGRDLKSAKILNSTLATHFSEDQIYRIDHYLGKETVQNLMAVRFGNLLFEPLWNSQYIDHIQITVAEKVDVEGRGEYYDTSGAMRDMVQNHLMQLLCLIAMEPPAQFNPDAVRDEKLKVIRALDNVPPHHIVRGQYDASSDSLGYREHANDAKSRTESYVAIKAHVRNWRWAGTPFYMRTGKCLRSRCSEIAVVFKQPPHSIFGSEAGTHRNALVIRLQPDEGITMDMTIKEPGPGGMRLITVPLDMTFSEALGPAVEAVPDAYERLIMDVIRGNQTLFMRGDEVEAAWEWSDPIIEGWKDRNDVPKPYEAGSSGPDDALMLLHRDDRKWRAI